MDSVDETAYTASCTFEHLIAASPLPIMGCSVQRYCYGLPYHSFSSILSNLANDFGDAKSRRTTKPRRPTSYDSKRDDHTGTDENSNDHLCTTQPGIGNNY